MFKLGVCSTIWTSDIPIADGMGGGRGENTCPSSLVPVLNTDWGSTRRFESCCWTYWLSVFFEFHQKNAGDTLAKAAPIKFPCTPSLFPKGLKNSIQILHAEWAMLAERHPSVVDSLSWWLPLWPISMKSLKKNKSEGRFVRWVKSWWVEKNELAMRTYR